MPPVRDPKRPRGASPSAFVDVRMRGFAERCALGEALAWVDAVVATPGVEVVMPEDAAGRILGGTAPVWPIAPPRAAEDGYAVRAEETEGASPYGPLCLLLQDAAIPLAPAAASLVFAGAALPPGADAILPFAAAQVQGPVLEVLAPAVAGAGIERRNEALRAAAALPRSRPLRAHDAALLATLGLASVEVVRRPRIRTIVAGPKRTAAGTPADACGPLLRALTARDGAVLEAVTVVEGRGALSSALAAATGCDVILVAGRSGVGPDDDAPRALDDVGEVALHGIAMRPGGSAGLGRAGGTPVVLLPGDPLGCLFAYELVAGRLVRRLGGREPELPHAVREVELARKLVSAVGFVDACSVRLIDGRAEPTGSVDEAGVATAVRADGFVIVPAPLEGYPAGARVAVHLHPRG
jgi:molybdopterin molybdotransferase